MRDKVALEKETSVGMFCSCGTRLKLDIDKETPCPNCDRIYFVGVFWKNKEV